MKARGAGRANRRAPGAADRTRLAGPGLLADTIVHRWLDHLPDDLADPLERVEALAHDLGRQRLTPLGRRRRIDLRGHRRLLAQLSSIVEGAYGQLGVTSNGS
ncbi:hypothetical protein [Nannocystis pusilla]|uniref:hypothetical protein n=1 Tax=Nannocystis pusilla TaxID=889268 RepID=UPI003DA64C3B